MLIRRLACFVFAALSTACAHDVQKGASDLRLSDRDQLVPLADAHQHTMSPTAQNLVVPHPELRPIELPAALGDLLKSREAISGGPPVAGVFNDQAIITQLQEGRWWQGHDRIHRFVKNFPTSTDFIPKSYAVGETAGFIAGNLRLGGAEHDLYNFMLGIKKNEAGEWQIEAEMLSKIEPPQFDRPIGADEIIEQLDDAGIKYGVLLSVAYWFGQPVREPPVENELAKTRAENDFTVAEAARYPDRLFPFCSVNPLRDYAISELERCAAIEAVRGFKIHFNNSRVDLENAEHVKKLQDFFRASNREGLAIVLHINNQLDVLIRDVLPAAPDVPVQIAHMASSWENANLFADAMEKGLPGTRNLYFDWTQALPIDSAAQSPDLLAKATSTMRRIGLGRILFGTDMPLPTNPSPRKWWRKTLQPLPLSQEELKDIADNVPPYIH